MICYEIILLCLVLYPSQVKIISGHFFSMFRSTCKHFLLPMKSVSIVCVNIYRILIASCVSSWGISSRIWLRRCRHLRCTFGPGRPWPFVWWHYVLHPHFWLHQCCSPKPTIREYFLVWNVLLLILIDGTARDMCLSLSILSKHFFSI